MKKKLLALLLSSLLFSSCGGFSPTVVPGGEAVDPFAYDGNFENSELTIDGKMLEKEWTDSPYVTPAYSFKYKNLVNGNTYTYTYRIYRGKSELFVFFEVEDCNILSYGLDNGSNVSFSDSCELYIDSLHDGGEYPQEDDYQIDLGVHSKTRILIGNGTGWSNWTGLVQYETVINGTLNDESDVDKGYTVEMSIPYKQIGIKRDDEIGVTLGIVDRFASSGGPTSKRWYGTTYKGHFGAPQVPSSYFTLTQNELKIPPLNEYKPAEDTTEYIQDVSMYVKEATFKSRSYQKTYIELARHNDIVSVRIKASTKWQEHEGYMFQFDFGDYSRASRDTKTYLLRVYPGAKSVKDFFQYPNTGASKAKLDVKVNDEYFYASFNILDYEPDFTGDVAFSCDSIDPDNQTIIQGMFIDGRKVSFSKISSMVQLKSDNTIVPYVDPDAYDPAKDTTKYIADVDIHNTAVKDKAGNQFGKINYKINREYDFITILATSETNWADTEMLYVFFDLGNPGKQQRNSDTYILRIRAQEGSIFDYFQYQTNISQDKNDVTIRKNKNQLQIAVNLWPIIEKINGYEENGIAFTTAVAQIESTLILQYAYEEGTLTGTVPGNWLRVTTENTIRDPAQEAKYDPLEDKTPYIAGETLTTPETSGGGYEFAATSMQFSRTNNKVTVLIKSEEAWQTDEMLNVVFDLGAKTRTAYDTNTVVLRITPRGRDIISFYKYPFDDLDKSMLEIKANDTYIQITLDLTKIDGDFTNVPVGLNYGVGYRLGYTVLTTAYYKGNALENNPSRFPRVKNDNTVSE